MLRQAVIPDARYKKRQNRARHVALGSLLPGEPASPRSRLFWNEMDGSIPADTALFDREANLCYAHSQPRNG